MQDQNQQTPGHAESLNYVALGKEVPLRAVLADIKHNIGQSVAEIVALVLFMLAFLGAIVAAAIAIIMMIKTRAAAPVAVSLVQTAIVAMIASVVMLIVGLSIVKDTRRALRLRQFAKDNGFLFERSLNNPDLPGVVFTVGHSREAKTIVSGQYRKRAFWLGNYSYVAAGDKGQQRHRYGVVTISLSRNLPHIFLDTRTNNFFGRFSNLPAAFLEDQRLQLEGDLNNHFDLYAPKEYQSEVQRFFAPELLAALHEMGGKYDIEVVDDQLFIYKDGGFDFSKKTVNEIFTLIDLLSGDFHKSTAGLTNTDTEIAPRMV